jgi:hypothetical protein
MSGKGSSPRPYSVDKKTFDNNWDRIFKKNYYQDILSTEDAVISALDKSDYDNRNKTNKPDNTKSTKDDRK